MDELIPVQKDGEYLEVHPTALNAHKVLGWRPCERREDAAPKTEGDKKLGIAELRAALKEKGIAFVDDAKKADLQALLDAAPKTEA